MSRMSNVKEPLLHRKGDGEIEEVLAQSPSGRRQWIQAVKRDGEIEEVSAQSPSGSRQQIQAVKGDGEIEEVSAQSPSGSRQRIQAVKVSNGAETSGSQNTQRNGPLMAVVDSSIDELEKEVLHLTNYFIVFQGMVFTALYSSSSNSQCRFRWLPIGLSLLSGLFCVTALSVTFLKCLVLISKREELPISDDLDWKNCWKNTRSLRNRKPWSLLLMASLVICFVGFFSVMFLASVLIPCSS